MLLGQVRRFVWARKQTYHATRTCCLKDHYTKKLEKLRDQIAKSGTSLLWHARKSRTCPELSSSFLVSCARSALVDKLNRNEEKKRTSQQAYTKLTTV